jgi:tRNA(His) 5'-end guanylyltransferase
MKDSLGNRIKEYENVFRIKLPEKSSIIMRLDGCHFHSYMKGCKKPIDENVIDCMNETAVYLCKNIQGTVFAYTQSDEINLLLDYNRDDKTQPWFDNNIQKMCSVASGMASAYFTLISNKIFGKNKIATFDCRVFNIPEIEVQNVFIWRQRDKIRNSIQDLARSLYSHKECYGKNSEHLKELCAAKGIIWESCPNHWKYGTTIIKIKELKSFTSKVGEVVVQRTNWIVDNNIPVFSKNKDYIEGVILAFRNSDNSKQHL